MYEFCCEYAKGYAKTYRPGLDCPEQLLQSADVPSIGKGGGSQSEILHVGKQQSSGDHEVEGCNINEESNGQMGEPWGAISLMGAGVPGAPWKTNVKLHSPKKEATQHTR